MPRQDTTRATSTMVWIATYRAEDEDGSCDVTVVGDTAEAARGAMADVLFAYGQEADRATGNARHCAVEMRPVCTAVAS